MNQPINRTRYVPFERPLGKIAGYLAEPESGFIDPYEAEEREAIQELEREEEIRIDYHAKRAKRTELAKQLERTGFKEN